jgi:hypothetical protein
MKRLKLILKSLLLLFLSILVYLKVKNPNPDLVFEITTDLTIVLIALGVAEFAMCFFYIWISSLFISRKKIANK